MFREKNERTSGFPELEMVTSTANPNLDFRFLNIKLYLIKYVKFDSGKYDAATVV